MIWRAALGILFLAVAVAGSTFHGWGVGSDGVQAGGQASPTATPLHGCKTGQVKLSYPGGQSAEVELHCPNVLPPGLGHWTVDVTWDPAIVDVFGCATDLPGQEGQLCSLGDDTVRFEGDLGLGTGDITLGSVTVACLSSGSSELTVTVVRLEDVTQRPIGMGAEHGKVECNGTSATPTATPPPANGDANKDGHVDSVDALLVLQYNAGLVASLPHAENCDVNSDGVINAVDAELILQFDAGLIDSLPLV